MIALGFTIYFADLSRVSNSLEQGTIQYGAIPQTVTVEPGKYVTVTLWIAAR